MPAGLILRNPSGDVFLTEDSRISRWLGVFSTGTSNGSLSFPEFGDGQGFIAANFTLVPAIGAAVPTFAISGATVSWTFPSTGIRRAVMFHVGVSS